MPAETRGPDISSRRQDIRQFAVLAALIQASARSMTSSLLNSRIVFRDAAAIAAVLETLRTVLPVQSRRSSGAVYNGANVLDQSDRDTVELALLEEHYWPSGTAGFFSPFVFDVYVDARSASRFPDAANLTRELLEAVIANLPAGHPANIERRVSMDRSDREVTLVTLPLVAEQEHGLFWTQQAGPTIAVETCHCWAGQEPTTGLLEMSLALPPLARHSMRGAGESHACEMVEITTDSLLGMKERMYAQAPRGRLSSETEETGPYAPGGRRSRRARVLKHAAKVLHIRERDSPA